MPRKPFNLRQLIDSNFEGASDYELNKAHEIKFNTSAPVMDSGELRAKLVKAFKPDEEGAVTTAQPPSSGDKRPPQRIGGGKVPNLKPSGRWEGRMRRVTIHKSDEKSGSGAYTVGWEGHLWRIAYEQTVDMPWPYWQSLLNTDFIDDRSEAVTKWEHDQEGRLICTRTSRRLRTVRYTDHGDVPGTEELPESYADFYRREALRTNCFAGFQRAALMMIHNTLREPRGKHYNEEAFNAAFFRDMKDIDIRIRIAEALGPDIESIMTDESYAVAEG